LRRNSIRTPVKTLSGFGIVSSRRRFDPGGDEAAFPALEKRIR